jgi:hypothetical protein
LRENCGSEGRVFLISRFWLFSIQIVSHHRIIAFSGHVIFDISGSWNWMHMIRFSDHFDNFQFHVLSKCYSILPPYCHSSYRVSCRAINITRLRNRQ